MRLASDLGRRRADRARQGSNRERDLKALSSERLDALRERRRLLLGESVESSQACWAYGAALGHLALSVPESTFEIWIAPLCLVGEVRGALHLEAPPIIASWVDRRYAELIGECVREHSDFKGVYISAADDEEAI